MLKINYYADIDSIYYLAFLYENQSKEKAAEKCYLLAIDKGDIEALKNLLINYFNLYNKLKIKNLINKLDAKTIELFAKENDEFTTILYLYISELNKFKERTGSYLNELNKVVSNGFMLEVLFHKQTNWAHNYFKNNQLAMENYKPLYYANLILKGDEAQELLKMPPEITENVNDIVKLINEKQKFYYG